MQIMGKSTKRIRYENYVSENIINTQSRKRAKILKFQTHDEETMNYANKTHVTTCNVPYVTNDVKKMKKQS